MSDKPKAHWILLKESDGGYTTYLQCSNCSVIVVKHTENIDTCPNCGLDMRGNKNER